MQHLPRFLFLLENASAEAPGGRPSGRHYTIFITCGYLIFSRNMIDSQSMDNRFSYDMRCLRLCLASHTGSAGQRNYD